MAVEMTNLKVSTGFEYAAHNEAVRTRLIRMRIGKELEMAARPPTMAPELSRGAVRILDKMLWVSLERSITDGTGQQALADLVEMRSQLGYIKQNCHNGTLHPGSQG